MNNIDLKGMPFNLNDEEIKWVNETKNNMSIEEKIGQLFFLIGFTTEKEVLKSVVSNIRPGGMMYRKTGQKNVVEAHKTLQSASKIPMLLAANIEAGGNGLIEEGTFYGHQMLVGATKDEEYAYKLGLISGREAGAVGGNMAFAPILDINKNFRNPITNVRSFGDDKETIAKMSSAYVRGAQDAGISVTIKHFPGDGMDGRDQHLVTTHNTCEVDEWRESFGMIYEKSIKDGARGLMVGHISLPAYMDKYASDKPELKYYPATLNPVLLNKLLREELGYNGLTMTDATLMTGFGQMGKRKDLVPESIAAGCDMFLFTRMPEDDYKFMMDGYKNGVITDERLDEALTRILAMKASLKMNGKTVDELVPDNFDKINKEEHDRWTKELAYKGVTLVKNDENLLPLDNKKYKKIGIMYNGNESLEKAVFGEEEKGLKVYEKMVNALNKQGFEAFYYDFGNIMNVLQDMQKPLEEWTSQFDAIIYLTKKEVMSNQTSLQLNYKAMGFDAPWFVKEVPTILVSLANPYQTYDLPMINTVINAYSATEYIFDAIAEKIAGKSKFEGISPVQLDFKEMPIIL